MATTYQWLLARIFHHTACEFRCIVERLALAAWWLVIKTDSILIVPKSLSNEQKEDYKAWLDEFVLGPLRDIDPWSFNNVVDSMKEQVKTISQHFWHWRKSWMANSDSMCAYMASHVINLFPSLVRAELLSDSKLLEELALATDVTVNFGDKDVAFSLTKGDLQILNDSFWPLCADVDRRLSLFEAEAKSRSLSKEELERLGAMMCKTLLTNAIIWNYLFLSDYCCKFPDDRQRQEVIDSIRSGSYVQYVSVLFLSISSVYIQHFLMNDSLNDHF